MVGGLTLINNGCTCLCLRRITAGVLAGAQRQRDLARHHCVRHEVSNLPDCGVVAEGWVSICARSGGSLRSGYLTCIFCLLQRLKVSG